MKSLTIALLVTIYILHICLAVPVPEEEFEGSLVRQKRVTCDVLSVSIAGFTANHAFCAANCLRLGRKGGTCKKGVCVCRK